MNKEEKKTQEELDSQTSDNVNPPVQQTESTGNAEGEQPKQTSRERYLERYRKAHPDMNTDDEESFYGKANENLDELEGYREHNKELGDTFSKNPTLAAMLLAAKEGQNPFVWLGENLGMDIKELADDPEFGKKLSDALITYQQKMGDGENAKKEMEKNFSSSVGELQKLQKERKMSDEETEQIYNKFFEEIVEPATKGIVSKDTWNLMCKAINYDNDMENARNIAATRATNQHIDNTVRKPSGNVPPSLPGAGKQASIAKRRGFFDGVK